MEKQKITVVKVVIFWGLFAIHLNFSGLILLSITTEYRDLATSLVTITLLLLLSYWLTSKHKSGLHSVGLSWPADAPKTAIAGTVAGAFISICILVILILLTPISINWIEQINYTNAIGYSAVILMALALMEEIAFRALPLFYLQKVLGTRIAIYSTFIAFAFYHGLDPMNLLGPGVWGIFFAILVLRYNNLMMATALHFGLNWIQSFFSLKTDYATGIWQFNRSEEPALIVASTLSLIIQISLLILAIVVVEQSIKNKPHTS